MVDELRPPTFRPLSLSLVTVTSLEEKRVVFDLTNTYRTGALGHRNDANWDNFYDYNTIGTPTIVIDHGSDPDIGRTLNKSFSCTDLMAQNCVKDSQLVKYLTPQPTRRPLSECPTLSTISSIAHHKELHASDGPLRSRNRDEDVVSIGGCSIGASGDISSDTHFESNGMNTRLINFVAVMYAMVVVMVSAIVCIHDFENDVSNGNHILVIITTFIGFVWIVFLHWDIHRYKLWAIEYLKPDSTSKVNDNKPNSAEFSDCVSISTAVIFNSIARKPNADESNASTVSPFETAYRFLHGKHSGNFYLKCGMAVFCIGSIIHMGVQIFNQIYFYLDGHAKCQEPITIVVLIVQSLYSFSQLFMAFKYSNIIINRNKTIARFALMHLVGTSISNWLCTILNEAIDEYVHRVQAENGTHNTSNEPFDGKVMHQAYCLGKSIVNKQSMDALPYLYPFTIEYNIILASVWYIIWTNIGKDHSNAHLHHIRRQISANAFGEEDVEYHSSVSINADCHASNRGLFAGLITLLGTFITIVMFFTTIKQQNYSNIGIGIYSAQIGVLTIVCCLVIPFAYKQMRKLDIVRHHHSDDSSTSMDDLLVLVPIPFYLLHYILSLIAVFNAGHSGHSGHSIFLIIIHVLTILQVLIQSPFIVDGIRRCSNTKQLRFQKPGRELITFALILNLCLWILNTFELKSVEHYHAMQAYYGKMTWMIISHTTLPLMLFYRFHSSVCLSDIWKYAYEKDHNLGHHIESNNAIVV